ncbi:FERM and PDZ domain-containing protein 4 [Trichinella pseudospiralis]|uniref:FERM and PDZ domain-containing protein 4 n=1 Tax=Trichinella pseudospiralis TaxID=6337 RepID=A0A0V1KCC3_TRIPS|nr:FERM and PDZ domain-containing protein 4 [Trichinella pseudospiralis]KRZ44927.1 FERM and PDZ domain-containing protein 4 [Trichinella pseudospiralis]KRZ44928.1 FERM and PDZ domain-containing protein 4 [Trichinella pseudospiralis]
MEHSEVENSEKIKQDIPSVPSSEKLFQTVVSENDLLDEWTIRRLDETERLIYLNKSSKTASWIPPPHLWSCSLGMPYGYEIAVGEYGENYYINHLNESTTATLHNSCDQQTNGPIESNFCQMENAKVPASLLENSQNVVEQAKHFQANSATGGDQQIMQTNISEMNHDLHKSCDKVDSLPAIESETSSISEFRAMQEFIPQTSSLSLDTIERNPNRKLQSRQSILRHSNSFRTSKRVHFAQGVSIENEEPEMDQTLVLEHVIKIYLENGQSKSFRYEAETKIQDMLVRLAEKLNIRLVDHFALNFEYPIGPRTTKLMTIEPEKLICQALSEVHAQQFRCLLRFSFMPVDFASLLEADKNAFLYLYNQSVSDVTSGRYIHTMRYDMCVRLAAIQILQTVSEHGKTSDSPLKIAEKQYGLAVFLPKVVLDNVQSGEIKKYLRLLIKEEKRLAVESTMFNLKKDSAAFKLYYFYLRYLNLLRQMEAFSTHRFQAHIKKVNSEVTITINQHPKFSVYGAEAAKTINYAISYHDLLSVSVADISHRSQKLVKIKFDSGDEKNNSIEMIMDSDDCHEFVSFLKGYKLLHTKQSLEIHFPEQNINKTPSYSGVHDVLVSDWNYAQPCSSRLQTVDFSNKLSSYESLITCKEYIKPRKENLPQPNDVLDKGKADVESVHEQEINKTAELLHRTPIFNLRMSPKRLLMAKDSIRIHNRYLAKSTPLLNETRKVSSAFESSPRFKHS